jgi:hypothetical protein
MLIKNGETANMKESEKSLLRSRLATAERWLTYDENFEEVNVRYVEEAGTSGYSVARSCQSFPASPAKKFGQFMKKYGPFYGLF